MLKDPIMHISDEKGNILACHRCYFCIHYAEPYPTGTCALGHEACGTILCDDYEALPDEAVKSRIEKLFLANRE